MLNSALLKKKNLLTLTLDLRTKKYPVPLARHTSLHRSLGEIPAYLGTHSTPSPEPSDTWADISLWARHCSSRNDSPGKGNKGRLRFTVCLAQSAMLACRHKKKGFFFLLNNFSPLVSGQASVLQERYWILLPSQYLPPFFGNGLSQERKEYCTPPPQVREQSPHGPHRPQPPLTGVWNTPSKL